MNLERIYNERYRDVGLSLANSVTLQIAGAIVVVEGTFVLGIRPRLWMLLPLFVAFLLLAVLETLLLRKTRRGFAAIMILLVKVGGVVLGGLVAITVAIYLGM